MLRVKFQKNNLVISAGFEYEDILTIIALKNIPESYNAEIGVSGKIIGGSDFTETLQNLGLDLVVKQKKEKETKKVQNYACSINAKSPIWITKDKLLSLMESLQDSCYLLLSFKVYLCSECSSNLVMNPDTKMYTCEKCGHEEKKPSTEYSVKTKTLPPRPTAKQKGAPKDEKQKLANKLKFCQVILKNTEKARVLLIDEIFPDFKDEIPNKVKSIQMVNTYHINNLIFPPRELMKNSKLFRKLTIREGSWERILDVGSNSFENVIPFKI